MKVGGPRVGSARRGCVTGEAPARGAPREGSPALLPSFARCVPGSRSGASLAALVRVGKGLEERREAVCELETRGAPESHEPRSFSGRRPLPLRSAG